MKLLRAFTVWTAAWFIIAGLVLAYGLARWGPDSPVDGFYNLFLTVTVLVQPLLCGIIWAVIEFRPTRWVKHG